MLQIRNTCNLKPHVYCIWRLLVKYGKASVVLFGLRIQDQLMNADVDI